VSLADRLAERIAAHGPISVADYMNACLHDPEGGYYATRPCLGERGDFITAPLISQMFGELIGLWAAEVWAQLGRPPRMRLVELGAGDGTMMSDVLRAAQVAPGFLDSAQVCIVERSGPLRRQQEATLANRRAIWLESIADIPSDKPLIILANEFLDCLPVRQAERTAEGWRERGVGVDARGRLAFVPLAPSGVEGSGGRPGLGAVFEWSDALAETGREIGALVTCAKGAALLIDYGRDRPGLGDTLQALRGHRKEHPLAAPGEADLTAHVDFPALMAAARSGGGLAGEVRLQRDFLRALGIDQRAAALAAARPDLAGTIARQLDRLIGLDQMGALFKVACIHSAGLAPPGFESAP
jgi:NADH dehydrogenase [ubiquinone] 1 alpha subcomplex assembly factor 7